ncbi:MAG TPA: LuxR C-terminal-related transcriptional regulator [Planococcus sp. (in: firmicutes)]|nr:LuxR C-terminal-related transcriptional regulator [Planococcus sp. (in: firmicutes)]
MVNRQIEMDSFFNGLDGTIIEEDNLILILKGFFDFFPFQRLSLFSYSPINYIGELLFFLDAKGGVTEGERIREDVRKFPEVYSAIHKKRAHQVQVDQTGASIPAKYIERFQLSSFLIVPVKTGPSVIGCVMIDRYEGIQPLSQPMVEEIEDFFRIAFQKIAPSQDAAWNAKLSKREVEVLEFLSSGLSTKEMAVEMKISEFTARDYISSAMRKLNVRHRAQAIAKVVRSGLIS